MITASAQMRMPSPWSPSGRARCSSSTGGAVVWRSSGVRTVSPLPARLAMSASTGAHRVSSFSLRSSAARAQVLIAVCRCPAEAARSPSCRGGAGRSRSVGSMSAPSGLGCPHDEADGEPVVGGVEGDVAAELVGEPQAQPGGAGIGDGQETGERVGRPVTAVGDGGHDAVRRGPQAEPDRGATVDERVGDRLADRENEVLDVGGVERRCFTLRCVGLRCLDLKSGRGGAGRSRMSAVWTATRAAAGVGSVRSITGGDAVSTGSPWLGGRRVRNSAGS